MDPELVGATGRVSDADALQDVMRHNHITSGMSGAYAAMPAAPSTAAAAAVASAATSRISLPSPNADYAPVCNELASVTHVRVELHTETHSRYTRDTREIH